MRVLKIIQANPELFNADPHKNYTEIEAIRLIASAKCKGNEVQKLHFEIRQTYIAICNLFELGFLEDAVELSISLILRAEQSHQFKIAQDLCNTLIAYYYQRGDQPSVYVYQSLYDKFTAHVFHENESMMLFGSALNNYRKIIPEDFKEIKVLLDVIEKKLPTDSLWYYYYYFHFKSIILSGKELEKLLLEAISFFEKLHFKHQYFTYDFTEGLISFYLQNDSIQKAERYLELLESGSIFWFRSYLTYTKEFLNRGDVKANDVCILTMNHPHFVNLDLALKTEWKTAYKASVKLLLKR